MKPRDRKQQRELVQNWERYCNMPSIMHTSKRLGIDWHTYNRYRQGVSPLPVAIQYAMQAIACNLPPWTMAPEGRPSNF